MKYTSVLLVQQVMRKWNISADDLKQSPECSTLPSPQPSKETGGFTSVFYGCDQPDDKSDDPALVQTQILDHQTECTQGGISDTSVSSLGDMLRELMCLLGFGNQVGMSHPPTGEPHMRKPPSFSYRHRTMLKKQNMERSS